MVRHIVFIKLEDFSKANEVKEKLESLKDNIDFIRFLEVGVDFNRSERAYDIALIVDVDNKEDLERYRVDEYHQEIIKYLKSINVKTKVVDYNK
jgi:uncharacterized coiled-coil DUF342 family protein